MTRRIFAKILLTVVALLAVTGLAAEYLVSRITAENLRSDLRESLAKQAQLARNTLEATDAPNFDAAFDAVAGVSNARVTVIDRQGVVRADSEANAATMENHASRPEFQEALRGGVGYDVRRSETVGVEFLYCAAPMESGAVRLALPLSTIDARLDEIRSQILRMLLLALAPATLLAAWLARRVSGQLSQIIGYAQDLAKGDFLGDLPEVPNDGELGQLADTIRSTGDQLRSTFEQLQDERSRFAAAVNGIGEGILVADRKQRIVLHNPAMDQMLPGPQLEKGSSLRDWPHPEIPELFDRVLETGEACSADVQVADPVERSWKVSCAPIVSRKGKVQAVVAVFYDITELERVDRMRKDFVINVSHELRTPLAAIQGYAETLLDGAIDDPATNRRFMKILWQNAERLAQLTADLMTLSQIEVNTREFHFSEHNVNEMLDQAAETIEQIARKKDVTVKVEHAPDNTVVSCDSGAIHQVLTNLLDNAAKYTSEGGSIRVGARRADANVEFYVADTGIGIAPEHIPRLFERFYRVDKARSRQLGGTGLGLAIVKHLVLSHRGGVRVESRLGAGSTFYFALPLDFSETAPQLDFRQGALF